MLLDYDVLNELKDVLEDEFSSLIADYISQASVYLDQLDDAVHESQPGRALEIAHSLKGSSLNTGAIELASLLKKLEDAIRSPSESNSQDILSEIQQVFVKTVEALNKQI